MKDDNLGQIASDIGNICAKWGRISVRDTKEKYNTVRVYCSFGIHNLHSLLFPRYVYKHRLYPDWLWKLDCYYFSKVFNLFEKIVIPYQKFVYNYAYWKYIKKYPHRFRAITGCMDYPEMIGFYIPRLCADCIDNHESEQGYLTIAGDCENCKKV